MICVDSEPFELGLKACHIVGSTLLCQCRMRRFRRILSRLVELGGRRKNEPLFLPKWKCSISACFLPCGPKIGFRPRNQPDAAGTLLHISPLRAYSPALTLTA